MYNRQKDFISKKYINQTETYGPIEVVSLLPNTENNDKKNYISFMFYEHKEEVTRYLNTRKKKQLQTPNLKQKYLCEIQMPLTNDFELFRDTFQVNSTSNDLDYFPNLFYEAIQKYGGDVASIANVLKEGKIADDRYNLSEESLSKLTATERTIYEGLTTMGLGTAQAASIVFGSGMNTLLYDGNVTTEQSTFLRGAKYSTGVAYNPNPRFMYNLEELQPRAFRFNYRFVPENREQIKRIRRAEYLFQKHSTPTKWTGDGFFKEIDPRINTNYINHFRWPKHVQIKIFIEGKEFKKFKYLPASIQRFLSSVDKAENQGDRTFIANEENILYPNAMSFIIAVIENKIFTRNDVDKVKNPN